MELGEKLRNARLEAGLSQRQLCGDTITRNMLSQIENGSARPSMDTLAFLARQLDKPISYFLEEQAVQLPNQTLMEKARLAEGKQVLELLEGYVSPDPVYDPERWLLEALTCIALARENVAEKPGYAAHLLEQAARAGEKTPYYTRETEQQRLLLCHRVGLPVQLEAIDEELLIRAQLAADPEKAAALLDAAEGRSPRWYFLRGKVYEQENDWQQAAQCYHQAEKELPGECYSRLEQCYRQLEDYKKAYEYACKQR